MSVPYYVYNTSSGEVLRVGFCPASMVVDQVIAAGEGSGQALVTPGVDTINTTTGLPNPAPGTLVPATLNDLTMTADGVDTARISGLLNGTRAVWFDQVVTEIGGEAEMFVTSNYAGSFECNLELPGYTKRNVVFVAS